MYFNRRENTIGGLYIAPNECPPRTKGVSKNACDPLELACDPEGGKKIVAEELQAQAQTAAAIAEAAIKLQASRNTEQRAAKADADAKDAAAEKKAKQLGDKK